VERELIFPDSIAQWFELSNTEHAKAKMATIMSRALPEIVTIGKALPDIEPKRVVDIGCGLGAKTMFLAWLYRIEDIHLLDGDGTKRHAGGYQACTEAWASAFLAKEFLTANMEPQYKVHAINVNEWDRAPIPTDLIVSFRAWGHHFAVRQYLDFAWSSLEPGGHVILDIRRNTDGFKHMIERGFKMVKELDDPSNKCCRMVYTK
jgi:SAM-dependent methyltransferase